MTIVTSDITRLMAVWKLAFAWSPLSAKDAERGPQIEEMLNDCDIVDDAERLFDVFRRYRQTVPAGTRPRWQDYVGILRQTVTPRTSYRAQDRRCDYCGDTGEMSICMPATQAGLRANVPDFRPGVAWTDGMVYRVVVPCCCTLGRRIEGGRPMSDEVRRLRDLWRVWFDGLSATTPVGDEINLGPTIGLNRYMRRCEAARRA